MGNGYPNCHLAWPLETVELSDRGVGGAGRDADRPSSWPRLLLLTYPQQSGPLSSSSSHTLQTCHSPHGPNEAERPRAGGELRPCRSEPCVPASPHLAKEVG